MTSDTIRLPPSLWAAELGSGHGRLVHALDEPDAMRHLVSAMPTCCALKEVDLSALRNHEEKHKQTWPRVFFGAAALHWNELEKLRLGPATISTDNARDAAGKFDIDYLEEALPLFRRLRHLDLSSLDLDSGSAWHVLSACVPACPVRHLDLTDIGIHQLADMVTDVDVVCGLESLKLGTNGLGEFDEDSVGTGETCWALETLITEYTSLRELDLSCNAMYEPEGRAIARALATCTHLRALALGGNYWDNTVNEEIRAAWRGPKAGLELTD